MTRVSNASLRASLAFGNASIAISEVKKMSRRGQPDASADDLLVKLNAAHVQLRELFAHGLDDAVCALTRDVKELASETTDVLNQDQEPSCN
jgi:hypothetical protein